MTNIFDENEQDLIDKKKENGIDKVHSELSDSIKQKSDIKREKDAVKYYKQRQLEIKTKRENDPEFNKELTEKEKIVAYIIIQMGKENLGTHNPADLLWDLTDQLNIAKIAGANKKMSGLLRSIVRDLKKEESTEESTEESSKKFIKPKWMNKEAEDMLKEKTIRQETVKEFGIKKLPASINEEEYNDE